MIKGSNNSEILKNLRLAEKLTQDQLAMVMGTTSQNISQKEGGKGGVNVKDSYIQEVCERLGYDYQKEIIISKTSDFEKSEEIERFLATIRVV